MPKHGKTRKQKMLADLRRLTIHQNKKKADLTTYSVNTKIQPNYQEVPSYSSTNHIKKVKTHVATVNYQYLTKDFNRTFLLTFSIIIAELMIKYFLNSR